MTAALLIRRAREERGITQAELARRLGVKQPSVARLEAAGDGVSVGTLRRAAAALGGVLDLSFAEGQPSVDDTLIAENLKLSPTERLRRFESFYDGARQIADAGARARGELA